MTTIWVRSAPSWTPVGNGQFVIRSGPWVRVT
jgi:hypothetical protein